MHANAALLEKFYKAFNAKDHATMASCYRPDATFSDPVFQDLRGPRVTAMWRMLCQRAKDLKVTGHDFAADDARGTCGWDADYTFAATGRFVKNRIHATFTFKDGLIATHVDAFPLWKWTSMALGMKGTLLGFLPPVQNAVRAQAMSGLDKFLEKEASAA